MRGEVLHGPTEKDCRAVHDAAARKRADGTSPTCSTEDEALALAAAEPSNRLLPRAVAWLAWAYNRSPLRAFLDLPDMPLLIVEGVLQPLWRWLAFRLLPTQRAVAYCRVAHGLPSSSSGWLGCLVVLPVWTGLAAVTLWLLLAIL